MIIDDNFLSNEEIKNLQDTMYAAPKQPFPWSFNPYTSEYSENQPGILKDDNVRDSIQFTHGALYNGYAMSPFIGTAKDLLNKFCLKNNIKVQDVLRIKANLLIKDSQASNTYHYPHVDSPTPHLVFLYYVNNSDGDTFFFDKKYTGQKINSFSIAQRVSPKAGRAVVFDGLTYHASSNPVDSTFRCVVNINFLGTIL